MKNHIVEEVREVREKQRRGLVASSRPSLNMLANATANRAMELCRAFPQKERSGRLLEFTRMRNILSKGISVDEIIRRILEATPKGEAKTVL